MGVPVGDELAICLGYGQESTAPVLQLRTV